MYVSTKPASQGLLLRALAFFKQHHCCGVQFLYRRLSDFGNLRACGVRCLIGNSLVEGKMAKGWYA
eukprot:1161476-Pelagomonas_calceolata.AAC.6